MQRQFRTLSFDPPLVQCVRSILGVSQATVDIMNRGVAAGCEASFLARLNKAVHPSLSAGPALDAMNKKVVRLLEHSLSELATKGPTTVRMYSWIRETVMVATTDSVFGPRNPFREPVNIAAWMSVQLHPLSLPACLLTHIENSS